MPRKPVSGALSVADLQLPSDPGSEATIDARLDYADDVAKKTGLILFIAVGRIYAAIKADHDGTFGDVIKKRAESKRGLAIRSVEQFMRIAECYGPMIAENPAIAASLPNDRTSLSSLAAADPITIEAKIADGEIHAGMNRKEATQAAAEDGTPTLPEKTPVQILVARFEKLKTALERSQFLAEAKKADSKAKAKEAKLEKDKAKVAAARKAKAS